MSGVTIDGAMSGWPASFARASRLRSSAPASLAPGTSTIVRPKSNGAPRWCATRISQSASDSARAESRTRMDRDAGAWIDDGADTDGLIFSSPIWRHGGVHGLGRERLARTDGRGV